MDENMVLDLNGREFQLPLLECCNMIAGAFWANVAHEDPADDGEGKGILLVEVGIHRARLSLRPLELRRNQNHPSTVTLIGTVEEDGKGYRFGAIVSIATGGGQMTEIYPVDPLVSPAPACEPEA